MARIVLAMSGGVDSSVAASLLCEQGHEVIGVFMRHGAAAGKTATVGSATTEHCAIGSNASHSPGERSSASFLPIVERAGHKQGCCSASDAEDGRRVADRLGIPFYALDFQEEFDQIIDYFVAEYTAARTPNPCVACNNWLKFGKLFDYADSVEADFVATGHYAQIVSDSSGQPALVRGIDETKDQSYVLFGVLRERLQRMLLPVGGYRKSRIRALARELGLRVADKKDSQEICFIPDGDHAAFIHRRQGPSPTAGEIVTTAGQVVGEHDGLERFTIGQRKGLGVALGEPRFVVRLEPETHRVVIGTHEELARGELSAGRVNWLVDPPQGALACHVKIRYNARAVPARVEPLGAARFHCRFDQPQFGVAPGQAVVCYAEDRVLGGGWIE